MKRGVKATTAALAPLHTRRFSPESRSFDLLDYSSLFEPSPGHPTSRLFGSVLGDAAYTATSAFYEDFAGALFGYTHKRKRISGSEDENTGYPDLIHTRRAFGLEVKSIAPGRPLDLRDNQIEYLTEFQRTHPSYKLSYVVFRHTAQESSLPEMKPAELLTFLTEGATAYGVVLPFDVISALYQRGEESGLGYRYNGKKKWRPRLRVNSGVIDRLALDPASVLERLDLDPANYRTSRLLFGGVKCHDTPISSSPLVRITNPGYRNWVRGLNSARTLRSEEERAAFVVSDSEGTTETDTYELEERAAIESENRGQPLFAASNGSREIPI